MTADDPKDDQAEADKTGADKRRHRRVDYFRPVKVVVPEDSTAIDVFSSNLSRGGIFLRANQPLPEGQKVTLDIETDKGQVKVDEGEVKWSKEFEPIDLDGRPPGMGVEFTKMSPEAEQSISDLIDEVVGDADSSSPPPVDLTEEPAAPTAAQTASPATPVSLPPEPTPLVPQGAAGSTEPAWPPKASMRLDLEANLPAAQPAPAIAPQDPEENMAAFTKPPSSRTRMLIFVGFVILVAVLTFLTLMWLKPFDEVADPGAPAAKRPPPAGSAASKPPAAEVTPPAADAKPPATDAKPPAADVEPPATDTEPPAADAKPLAATAGPPMLEQPTFVQAGSGWRMVVRASGPVAFKSFTLKAPPRLVIDVKGASWNGPGQVTAPAPFVSRIRFGRQPDAIRLVLDFTSGQIPKHAMTTGDDQMTIRFP